MNTNTMNENVAVESVVGKSRRREYEEQRHLQWTAAADSVSWKLQDLGKESFSYWELRSAVSEVASQRNCDPNRLFNHFLAEEILEVFSGGMSVDPLDFAEGGFDIGRVLSEAEPVFEKFGVRQDNNVQTYVVNYFLRGIFHRYIWAVEDRFDWRLLPVEVSCLEILDELPKHMARIKELGKRFHMDVESTLASFDVILAECKRICNERAEAEAQRQLKELNSDIQKQVAFAVFAGDSEGFSELKLQLKQSVSEVFSDLDDAGKTAKVDELWKSVLNKIEAEIDVLFEHLDKCSRYGYQKYFDQVSKGLVNTSMVVPELVNPEMIGEDIRVAQRKMSLVSVPLRLEVLSDAVQKSRYSSWSQDIKNALVKMEDVARSNLGSFLSLEGNFVKWQAVSVSLDLPTFNMQSLERAWARR